MRPVAAPDDPIGSGLDEGTGHGLQALEVSVPGKAIRSRQLDPSPSRADHVYQTIEVGVRKSVALEHVPHMIDDEVSVEAGQAGQQIASHPSGGIELYKPAELCRAPERPLVFRDECERSLS